MTRFGISTVMMALVWGSGTLVSALPTGAPTKACTTMAPQHYGTTPQTTPPPFELRVLSSLYRPSQNLTVILAAPCGSEQFAGFLLEVRRADVGQNRDEPLGTFTNVADSKYVPSCGVDGRQAVTHRDVSLKSLLSFQWTAPPQGVGHVVFVATFASAKSTYWVKVYSEVIRQDGLNTGPDPGTAVYPTPSTCSVVPTQPPAPTLPQDGGCGIWKSCISDCTDVACGYIVSWANATSGANTVLFELATVVDRDTNRWMAIGFSDDRQMGEDKVVECVSFNNAINVYSSYNTITPRLENRRNENPQPTDGIIKVNATLTNGIFRCTFLVLTEQFSYINLSVPWYLLFDSGNTATFKDTKLPGAFPPVSEKKILFLGDKVGPGRNESIVDPNSASSIRISSVHVAGAVLVTLAIGLHTRFSW